jgi:hypothetical protein
MTTSSPIATLLKQRPIDELEAMRTKAETAMETAKAELQWIEDALAEKRPKQKRRVTRKGDTKKRVLAFISEAPEPVGPADVRDALNATGEPIGSSAVYNTFKRLHDAGEIERVDSGLYRIAAQSQNGHRANEIGGPEPLSMASTPHEGQT